MQIDDRVKIGRATAPLSLGAFLGLDQLRLTSLQRLHAAHGLPISLGAHTPFPL
jgi:hypothetical protein